MIVCLQRYRRGQRGDKTFQRGGHNDHFKRRHAQWQRQDDPNHKGTMSENHSQMNKNTQENGNQEKRSEDSRSVQNGGDPLSFVLGDCDREEGQSGSCNNYPKNEYKHFLQLLPNTSFEESFCIHFSNSSYPCINFHGSNNF